MPEEERQDRINRVSRGIKIINNIARNIFEEMCDSVFDKYSKMESFDLMDMVEELVFSIDIRAILGQGNAV